MSRKPDAAEMARLLGADMASLVAELLPAARRQGREAVVGGLHGAPGHSMVLHLAGPRQGHWKDFASGEGGDALDLVAAMLFAGDKAGAWRWALRRYGHGEPGEAVTTTPRPAPPPVDPAKFEAEEAEKRANALKLFLAARPLDGGCPASLYLEARGIALRDLGRIPNALRFHPTCWCEEVRRKLPALVCAVARPGLGHVATHRIWIEQRGGAWRKAVLETPKKAYGAFGGGHVPLWRGASGKPLARAVAGEALAVAEGVETALSVAVAMPEMRVIAAVSLWNIGRVELPDAVRDIVVCADNDPPGSDGDRGLERVVARLVERGFSVRVARSSVGKDFNDALVAA